MVKIRKKLKKRGMGTFNRRVQRRDAQRKNWKRLSTNYTNERE